MALFHINKTFVDSKPLDDDFKVNPKTGQRVDFVEYKDDRLRGFILRVTRKGVKSYIVRARIKGGENISLTIGKHGVYNPTTARERANELLALMRLGIDPRLELKEHKALVRVENQEQIAEETKTELTLRAAFQDFCATNRKVKDSTKYQYEIGLNKHFADWLDLPMAQITTAEVVDRYNQIAELSGSAATSNFKAVSMLFNRALAEQEDLPEGQRILTRNPVQVLSRKGSWIRPKPRTVMIQSKDLPAWFEAVQAIPHPSYSGFFTLALVTGMRREEIFGLLWVNIDFDKKTFTARDTKNGSDHVMPMTALTERLFLSLPKTGKYVFAGRNEGKATNINDWVEKIRELTGIEFTPHALRRTFANMAEESGISYGQLQMLLNHSPKGDVTRTSYLQKTPERMRGPLMKAEKYILSAAKQRVKLPTSAATADSLSGDGI